MTAAAPDVMSKSAFARAQGWSPGYVTKLKQHGRLVLDADGNVQVADTLARIAATAGLREDVAQRHAATRGGQSVVPGGAGAKPGAPSAYGGTESRAAAQGRKEAAQADLAEMERDRMRGNLIPKEAVDAAMRFVGATIFALLDNFPGQNAAIITPVTSVDETEALLAAACRDMQTALGEAIARQKQNLAGDGQA